MKYLSLLILVVLLWQIGLGQTIGVIEDAKTIQFSQIRTDSMYNSRQVISLITIPKSSVDPYIFKFAHSGLKFKTTSSFCDSLNAQAGINGGFFNMQNGGSVTYFEINDSVISRTRDPGLKWGISDSLMNGAVVLDHKKGLLIERRKPEQIYESSTQKAVLITGPILLIDAEKGVFPKRQFVSDRHPRTCLCTTAESIKLITIDGRQDDAAGMNLYETQEFLLNLGCINAINLDGGGSTTMWINGKGVVNSPSDKTGERAVSNVLLILKKNN